MSTIRDLLADAGTRLQAAGVPSPSVDAALLMSHVLGIPRGRLLLHDEVGEAAAARFEALVAKRRTRVPLQHLLGTAGFRRLELAVGPGVFVPRPETELVAETAIRRLRDARDAHRPRAVAVDLCAGSGALGLSLAVECRDVDVHLVELSGDAVVWLRRNMMSTEPDVAAAGSTVTLLEADVHGITAADGPLVSLRGEVDVVVSNPPYVPDSAIPREPEVRDHDPALALYGGSDGLDVVRAVVAAAGHLLRSGGMLVIEHGDEQGDSAGRLGVPGVLREAGGWIEIRDHADLAGRPRFTRAARA